jgi:O-antigen ligase
MPPFLALFLWLFLLVALFLFDPAKERGTSLALWVPITWMFILGTRLPSQWLRLHGGEEGAEAIQEGDPTDRTVFLILIALAVGILMSRSFNRAYLVTHNVALMAFLAFSLLSITWSDFPIVAFKRWFRDLGNYFMILVVLSDPRPLQATRTLLRRLCYLVIPLCILLFKYFPEMSRSWDPWTGVALNSGATTSKNMLGVACLISGLFFFWDTVVLWADRGKPRTKQVVLVNAAFLAMTLWLLRASHSATSELCLALGWMVILAAHSHLFQRWPLLLKAMVPAGFLLYLYLAFGLGYNAELTAAVGRNATLSDRTLIWSLLLSMQNHPVIGTGYESFWLGPRLLSIWEQYGAINEAHNGYIEVYLNLGAIGLCLLVAFLIGSYWTICKKLRPLSRFGSLALAIWAVFVFHNLTEADFRGGPLWLALLLAATVVAVSVEDREQSVEVVDNESARETLPGFHLESTGPWR